MRILRLGADQHLGWALIDYVLGKCYNHNMQQNNHWMRLKGARTHNLKNVNIDIPLKQFTVVTGVSGSGKSSLVFDTLYAEGQRRYVESLSTYTRQFLEKMPKPDIDSLDNISPAIALEQRNHINNSRSTVATMSELYDYLRLLYAKVGHTHCLKCGQEVVSHSPQSIAQILMTHAKERRFYVLSCLPLENLSQKTWKELRQSLMQAGFARVIFSTKKSNHDIQELNALEKLPANINSFYLVIDRMGLPKYHTPETNSRLMDALTQALNHGMGAMTVGLVTEGSQDLVYQHYSEKFRCDECHIDYPHPTPALFSFNSPLGACSGCSGFGFNLELDENLIVPEPRKTIKNGAVDPFSKPAYMEWHYDLLKFCEKNKISVGKRYEDLSQAEKKLIWNGDGSKKGFPGIHSCFEELKAWKYKLHVRVFIRRYQTPRLCMQCHGSRLNNQALAVKVGLKNIAEILSMPIENACGFFQTLNLSRQEAATVKDILRQIQGRLQFLVDVGVGYLTLNRLGKTLSGGECQRINLATQLGNKLCSTLYVLDEPSIGLHPCDTDKLIGLLHQLRNQGNTVVVVEHDLNLIKSADHIVELGPKAGYLGGEVIAQGPFGKILHEKGCLTAKYLTGVFSIPRPQNRRAAKNQTLKIAGANENNLKNITVEFPLYQFIAVTGLSGSGKTTLVHRTLYNALSRIFHKENLPVGHFERLYGSDLIHDIALLDQHPIGKTARSNPATYLKIWDDVRKIYANQSQSIRYGYGPQHFSFNVDGGRCPVCKGEGEITLEMHFMADLKLPCEECEGKKFKKKILEVEFKRKNVHEILHTTIDECFDLFREYPHILSKLQILQSVGLGYLGLGQSATTLSGGESQRLKIASRLLSHDASNILYIFDEPTTGLHLEDVKKLLNVLHSLVDNHNTVIVIEHNLDLIAQADWVIDLGPGGGSHGGFVVAQGPPETIAQAPQSLTGKYLKNILS